MSNPPIAKFSWQDVRELVKDGAGAYAGLYLYKGGATAMHHIVLYMISDAAYIFVIRKPVLDKILAAPPATHSDSLTVDMSKLGWDSIFMDYGVKLAVNIGVDVGYELLRGRDAVGKKIIYNIVMGLSGFAVIHGANYIDTLLPVSAQGYINS